MDTVPSRLREVYWRFSFEDLKSKLRTCTSFQQVRFAQEFQTLAEIVSAAFGTAKTKPDSDNKHSGTMAPKNGAEAASMLKAVLGR